MLDGPGKGRPRRPRIDANLSVIFVETEALRKLASDLDKAQDGARVYDFSLRWGLLTLGRLKRLEYYYRAGELAKDEEARYQQLRRELGDAMPLIERLGLGRPPVPLED